jgi:hypothetical protein
VRRKLCKNRALLLWKILSRSKLDRGALEKSLLGNQCHKNGTGTEHPGDLMVVGNPACTDAAC